MIINAENIEEGMTLQEPVLNSYGFVLIPTGFELTQKHIKLLKTWNIKTVNVISEEEAEADNFSDELLLQAKLLMANRIKWEPRNDFEEIIMSEAINSIARQIKKSNNN